jgi:phenol 2-monooxygenase
VERKSAVETLINYDKDISLLMTHKWPAWYKGDPAADPYLVLGEIFEKAASFNTGLGISYSSNVLNQSPTIELSVAPGSRAPDVEVTMPGINQQVRMHRLHRNVGKFWVVVFAGSVESTRAALSELRSYLETNGGLYSHRAIGWITLSATVDCSPYEALGGMLPFGDTYFDAPGVAHKEYGIDLAKGGVVVIRPDGLIGYGCAIDGASIREYFSKIMRL